jgi:hypothetical protein
VAYQYRSQAILEWAVPEGMGGAEAERRLAEALRDAGPFRFERIPSGKLARAVFGQASGARPRLLAWLRAHRGRRLLG